MSIWNERGNNTIDPKIQGKIESLGNLILISETELVKKKKKKKNLIMEAPEPGVTNGFYQISM